MAKYAIDEEQRGVVRNALLSAVSNIKSLRKKNEDEGLRVAVSDCDRRLQVLQGSKGGTPGLVQIFSNQEELFADKKTREDEKKKDSKDPAQQSLPGTDGKGRRKRAAADGKKGRGIGSNTHDEVIAATPAGNVPDDQRTATTADGSDLAGGTDVAPATGARGVDKVNEKLGRRTRRAPAAGNLADTVADVTAAAGLPATQ